MGWFLIIYSISKGEEFLLKEYGCHTKAVITPQINFNHRSGAKPTYLFEFWYDDTLYNGNSFLEVNEKENRERIGDTIEVVFLKFLPERNRPVYFLDEK